jgi:glutamine amidotransferase
MTRKVTVVDYGVGNLLSVCRALEHVGAEPALASDPAAIIAADRLVLPGVGAFGPAMETLVRSGLADAIKETTSTRGRPFLGICLGMQMMLETSLEFGCHNGLGLIPGTVERIGTTDADGIAHPIPHIGWAPLSPAVDGESWKKSILSTNTEKDCVYFVHSFVAIPTDPEQLIAIANYNGLDLSATIGSGNLWGCQFHPEKSGPVGLKIMNTFLSI